MQKLPSKEEMRVAGDILHRALGYFSQYRTSNENECTHTFTGAGSLLVLRGPTPPPIQDTGHFTLDSPVQDILEDKPEVFKLFCQSMDEENWFGNGWKRFVKIQM